LNQQYHDGYHQQKVNQAAGDMKSKTEQPKDEQNRENGPKHTVSPRFEIELLLCLDAIEITTY
jgi:hypothetical protein